MTERDELRIVHIGSVAQRAPGEYALLKNYAAFYNELAVTHRRISVFAPFITQRDAGYEFLNEAALASSVQLTTVPGNSANVGFDTFVANNLRVMAALTRFCTTRGHYFVFLPSLAGASALLSLLTTRRYSSLGLYIGGDFAAEQQHEQRSWPKRLLKSWGAPAISTLIDRGIRRADYVVTTSPLYFQRYRDIARIHMAPPLLNVGPDDLATSPPPPPTGVLSLVYCGELRTAKGVLVLVEGFRRLVAQSDRPFALRIIGSGHAEPQLRALVREHGLADRVEFVGQVADRTRLAGLLRDSFALVLPSYSEGFPRVAYECFTLGVPTLLTAVGGIPYLVRDGEHTLFVDPGAPDDIARAVLRLAGDPQLRETLIRNGRQLMRDKVFPIIASHGSLARAVERGLLGQL
jgi:glycosyltransferase involved in cell wall biosynthesis